MAQLVMAGDDGALAILVKLRTACTAKDLHDVQDAQVHQGAALGVVDLRPLRRQTGAERLAEAADRTALLHRADWTKTLMMTAWAGRLTPQARVAVQTSTLM